MNAVKLLLCACYFAGCSSDPHGFKGDVISLRFSPDGKQLLAWGSRLRICQITHDREVEIVYTRPRSFHANWNPDGTAFYYQNPSDTGPDVIEKRSSTTFEVLRQVECGSFLTAEIVEVGPNHLVIAPQPSTNFAPNLYFEPEILNLQGATHEEKYSEFGGCSDGNVFRITGTGGDRSVLGVSYEECPAEIWDVIDLKMVKRYDLPVHSSCWIEISSDGQKLAALNESKLTVWTLENDKPVEVLRQTFGTPRVEDMWEYQLHRRLSFDKTGTLIAACSEEQGVQVIDVNKKAVVFELKDPIKTCALSPDGKTIAVAYASKGRVQLFPTGL